MIPRRLIIGLIACAALGACQPKAPEAKSAVKEINFAILPAEGQKSMGPLWEPLLAELSKQIGVKVKPHYASSYTAMIEAMRFDQVQAGWFSALPALDAVRRADGEVLGRIVNAEGADSYQSVLITQVGSGINLERVMKCDKSLTFGIGDAKSTSGYLAPMTYLFTPKGITPADCFKVVRTASHEANANAVANGLLQVGTNNSVGLVFFRRQRPALADKLEVIWSSPPLPESSIVVRKSLDPAIREKMRTFFLTYGTGTGPDADRQRAVLKGLTYGGFKAADDSYLDPIREMEAAETLAAARRGGDKARIIEAQKNFDEVQTKASQRRAVNPDGG